MLDKFSIPNASRSGKTAAYCAARLDSASGRKSSANQCCFLSGFAAAPHDTARSGGIYTARHCAAKSSHRRLAAVPEKHFASAVQSAKTPMPFVFPAFCRKNNPPKSDSSSWSDSCPFGLPTGLLPAPPCPSVQCCRYASS